MNHLDINQIKEIIPHRHPFLLLDYIEDYVPGEYAVGYKCVSYREEFFAGQTKYVWRRRSSGEKGLSVSARQSQVWMER